MDYLDRFPEDWVTITVSGVLSLFFTVVYLFFDFEPHQPLFYVFCGLSLTVLAAEYRGKGLVRVTATIREVVDGLLRLRHEEKLTFCGTAAGFFLILFCLSQQMDDAALIYAACMLLSASPLFRKLLGHSSEKLSHQASQFFQPPATETAELADYMPTINEISQDFSFRHRKNTNDSNVTDRELDVSAFGEDALVNMDVSTTSLLNESQIGLSFSEKGQLSSRTTDDDTSPFPSDVEMVDADDVPEDFPSRSSIASGRLLSENGSFTSSGTLRRHRRSSKERQNDSFLQ